MKAFLRLANTALHLHSFAGGSADAKPLQQHLSDRLERAFTPHSAKAVGSALEQIMQALAQEEEAQVHQMPPALAALQRGKLISKHTVLYCTDTIGTLSCCSHVIPNYFSSFAESSFLLAQSPCDLTRTRQCCREVTNACSD